MKNLFFTAIAMVAFSFAGNATNLVNSSNSKKVITIEKAFFSNTIKIVSKDDCTWTQVGNKAKKIYFPDGTWGWEITQIWQCI